MRAFLFLAPIQVRWSTLSRFLIGFGFNWNAGAIGALHNAKNILMPADQLMGAKFTNSPNKLFWPAVLPIGTQLPPFLSVLDLLLVVLCCVATISSRGRAAAVYLQCGAEGYDSGQADYKVEDSPKVRSYFSIARFDG